MNITPLGKPAKSAYQTYVDNYNAYNAPRIAREKAEVDEKLAGQLKIATDIIDQNKEEKIDARSAGQRRGRAATILRPLGGSGAGIDSFGMSDMPSARRTLLGA